MKNHTLALLFFGAWAALPATATADDSRKEWWHDSLRDPYWERACEVKLESKPGEFKREIKCKNGRGATWHGEWKDEFRDGRCNVKLEASRETFKEEVKCDRR